MILGALQSCVLQYMYIHVHMYMSLFCYCKNVLICYVSTIIIIKIFSGICSCIVILTIYFPTYRQFILVNPTYSVHVMLGLFSGLCSMVGLDTLTLYSMIMPFDALFENIMKN